MKKKENDHLDDKEEDDECMSRWFIFLMCSQFGSLVWPSVMENKAWENQLFHEILTKLFKIYL